MKIRWRFDQEGEGPYDCARNACVCAAPSSQLYPQANLRVRVRVRVRVRLYVRPSTLTSSGFFQNAPCSAATGVLSAFIPETSRPAIWLMTA